MRWAGIILLLTAGLSNAGNVEVIQEAEYIGINLNGIVYPEEFQKDITSGLRVKLLILLKLKNQDEFLKSEGIEVWIKYDLWEEQYDYRVIKDSSAIMSKKVNSISSLNDILQKIRIPSVFLLKELLNYDKLSVTADVLLNPVEKEKLDNIKKWVIANSMPNPRDPTLTRPKDSEDNYLFGFIFEQYVNDATMTTNWVYSMSSKTFSLQGMLDAK